MPVLIYGSEIWGYGDFSIIEKVHTDFMKYILNVKQSTPQVMLYGEQGRYHLQSKKIIISFCSKMLLTKSSKLSSGFYSVVYNDSNVNSFNFTWLNNVEVILDEVGMNYIWNN